MKKIFLIISLLINMSVFADSVKNIKNVYKAGVLAYREDDYKEAAKLFKEACDNNYGLGCLKLGSLYESGNGVAKNKVKSIKFYKKSCTSNENYSGCYTLNKKALTKEESRKFFTNLCNDNIGIGCFYLAKSLKGKEMAELYLKACDNGYPKGCVVLAKKKKQNKIKLLNKACDKNYFPACRFLGKFYTSKNCKLSIEYLMKGCNNNDALSCFALSGMYAGYSHNNCVDKDIVKAREFCKKSGQLNNDYSCNSDLE